MYPYLTELGPFRVSTYALAIAVGWVLGVLCILWLGRRAGLSRRRLVDLTFWILIAGIIGSRLAWMIEQAPLYLGVCLDPELPHPPVCDDLLRPWRGGFVFYGGLIVAFPVAALLGRRYRLPFWPTVDVLAPGLALTHAFGRVGCLFGGCCYGEVAFLPWAVRFPHESFAGPLPRHPTQLYEAGAELAVFGLLILLTCRKRFHGQVLLSYLLLYPAARFFVELFRGDAQRGYAVLVEWDGLRTALGLPPGAHPLLSWAQILSLTFLIAALALWRWRAKRGLASGLLPAADDGENGVHGPHGDPKGGIS